MAMLGSAMIEDPVFFLTCIGRREKHTVASQGYLEMADIPSGYNERDGLIVASRETNTRGVKTMTLHVISFE